MAPFLRSRLAVALLTALLAAAAVTAMRTAGLLESAYDRLLSLRSDRVGASRVLVVGHTERDIMANQDYPLPDARLARILAAIAAHGPRAIGVDFFRDVPVQEGREQLDALLLRDDRRWASRTSSSIATTRSAGPCSTRTTRMASRSSRCRCRWPCAGSTGRASG
jgi:CHASE2 domain-containing sensor protein